MTSWPTRLAAFATGTGTAETAEQSVVVPANAVELIALRMAATSTLPSVAESVMGVGKLKGNNWQNNPYEIAAEIGAATLSAINGPFAQQPRWWKANLPVSPNSTLSFTYEPVDALAGDGQCQVEFRWSDVRTGIQGVKRLFSREIATSTTTNTLTAINDAVKITRAYFAVGAATVAADDPGQYSLTLESSGLAKQQTMQVATTLIGIEATSGMEISYLMDTPVDIDLLPNVAQLSFSATLTETAALGTAGQWMYGVEYIPRNIQGL